MSLTAEHEIIIRRAVATKMANVSDAGFIIPAPIFFVDKADFQAQINSLALDTQKELELASIAFCSISLFKFEDSPAEGCADQPLVRLTYNFYFFREFDLERADETETPDDFLKKTLKSYNSFVKAVLDARNEFLGLQSVPDLPEGFEVNTNSLTQAEFINELQTCRFIPNAKGHSVNLQLVVEILING